MNNLRDLDANCGLVMAYMGSFVSNKASILWAADSDIAWHETQAEGTSAHFSVAALAWRSLAAAGEHAGFAEHMRFATSGGIVARPQGSLARATLLGAARAIYILSGESREEQRLRAARLANAEAQDVTRFIDAFEKIPNEDSEYIANLRSGANNLAEQAADVLRCGGQNVRSKITETEMLKFVSEVALADRVARVSPSSEVMAIWSRASGIAHARSWTWSLDFGRYPALDFLSTWSWPLEFMVCAVELWNERRGLCDPGPVPPDDWEPDRDRWGPFPGGRDLESGPLRP